MEPDEVATSSPNTTFPHEEICENATILDEGIRLCPLCRSEVRLFFINFNEKILMCENADCEYPFGHENVTYVKEDNEAQSDEEVASIKSKLTRCSPTATLSTMSTAAWSDIDKINKVYDSEDQFDHRPESREYYTHKNGADKITKAIESQRKIFKKVRDINKLSLELSAEERENSKTGTKIKNEKWIKNLFSKQQMSGVLLLNPDEFKLFKTKQLDIGTGELKIDIDMGNESNNNVSSIKIELANINTDVQSDKMVNSDKSDVLDTSNK